MTKKKGLQHYFNRIESAHRQLENDIVASGRYVYVGVQNGYKVYIEKATGQIMRTLLLEPLSDKTG